MAVRPIDGNELYRIEKLLDTDIVRQDKVALNLLEQVLYDIQHVPTLTPPNEWVSVYDRLRELVQADREGRCVVIRPNSVTDDNYKIIRRKINAEDIHLGKMRNVHEEHK